MVEKGQKEATGLLSGMYNYFVFFKFRPFFFCPTGNFNLLLSGGKASCLTIIPIDQDPYYH